MASPTRYSPRYLIGFLGFAALLLLPLPPAHAGPNGSIAPGDVIAVQVYGHPDLNVTTSVAADGTINYPLIGQVKVAGLSIIQAGKVIAQALSQGKFIRQPEVTVYIRENLADQLSVLGQVGRPGRYAVTTSNDRLFDVLAMAGGLTQAAGDEVVVIRPKAKGSNRRAAIDIDQALREGGPGEDLRLQPGDVVYVPRASVVYIYGQVNRPGAYPISREMTVRQLIALAGGVAKGGSTGGIKITVRKEGKSQTRGARMSTLVLPGEVIYVPESLF